MKKTVKKLTAVGLTLTSVLGLVACGSGNGGDGKSTTAAEQKEITKPDKFTVMCDGTVVTESNGADAFYKQMKEATGLDIEWVRPDHASYYDGVANAFNSDDTMPDVVLLSSDYYALYAANGFLWDMTDAWTNSETKKSGRLISTADNVLSALMVNGEDGTKAMYGLSLYRGNGCCTYIKKAWLDKANIDVAKVKDVQMDFNTYYGYLKQMAQTVGHYVISGPGFVSKEAPYTNYLPEFYQQANFTFYQDSSGKYVDGFAQQSMKDALQRLQTAVNDGVIDKETVNNSTANARDKFYSTDPANEAGVFTYWAGTWANTLKTTLANKGLDDELIAIKPIKELGTYVERIAPCWCITTHAKNPEGIFKYFIDKMLDGGTVQMLWTHGAKGTHWDDKAESVTVKGKEDAPQTYTEGQFHYLAGTEKPDSWQTKNHIDPILSIADFTGGYVGESNIPAIARENGDFFANNSTVAVPLPMTTELSDNIGDVNTARMYVIAQVSLGYMTVDEGMDYYQKTVGSLTEKIVNSLNK